MVRNTEDGSDHFLHIKEGVTQGDPLDIIAYGIGVLPLIREIQDSHPCVSQPWYAGDTGEGGGGVGNILEQFQYLHARGPPRG